MKTLTVEQRAILAEVMAGSTFSKILSTEVPPREFFEILESCSVNSLDEYLAAIQQQNLSSIALAAI